MQQQRAFDIPPIDELVDLAIRIARDVGQHGGPGGTLVQPVDRHDGKQLIDGPAVGQRLEHGEIAEVRIAQQAIELGQFFRHVVHAVDHAADLAGDGPEQVLGHGSLFQRQVAGAEQIDGRVEPLLGVVKRLEHVARLEFVERVVEVADRLWRRVGDLFGDRHLALLPSDPQHIEQQGTVVRDDRTPAFGNDVGMRHPRIVTDRLDVIHDVVAVLLQRVIDAGGEIGLRTVVVDSQTAAHIHVLQPGTAADQIGIDAGRLHQRVLHVPNAGDLAAQVEMQQLQAIGHVPLFEHFDAR